jgi:hypothetical protein
MLYMISIDMMLYNVVLSCYEMIIAYNVIQCYSMLFLCVLISF